MSPRARRRWTSCSRRPTPRMIRCGCRTMPGTDVTDAMKTRVLRHVLDRMDAHGPHAGTMYRYSKLECGHLVNHGPVDRVWDRMRTVPEIGTAVCCRRCTNAARGR